MHTYKKLSRALTNDDNGPYKIIYQLGHYQTYLEYQHWHAMTDFDTEEEAMRRVNYLNAGNDTVTTYTVEP